MAHNLFKGTMAFVGETPWHNLGIQVPPTLSSAEMCEAASLDWRVTKSPAPGARLLDKATHKFDRYLVCREAVEDESGPVALGMVGSGYEPLQNKDAFEFFEPLIDTGFARFHTAGALGNGERVWVLAQLNEQIVVGDNDAIDRFILLSNSHDGSGAVSVRFTPIRVVCQNTLNLAVKEGGSSTISIRHTRHMQKHMAKAQAEKLHQVVDRVFADAADLFAKMALRPMTFDERFQALDTLFPRPREQESRSRRKRPQLPLRWQRINAILDDEMLTPRATASTAWGLYNAITRDEDYRATRELGKDARLERVWFGSGEDTKIKAFQFFRNFVRAA